MEDWDKFVANSAFDEKHLTGRYTDDGQHEDTQSSYELDQNTETCQLKCNSGFWATSSSVRYPSTDIFSQRCVSNNCKDYDYTKRKFTETAIFKPCSECWDQNDLNWTDNVNTDNLYNQFDGKGSYTREELKGRVIATPFKKVERINLQNGDSVDVCELQCRQNFWQDYKECEGTYVDIEGNNACTMSKFNPSSQRCTYDNCKNWDSTHPNSVENCSTCWSDIDLKHYKKFKGKNSYKMHAIMGRN